MQVMSREESKSVHGGAGFLDSVISLLDNVTGLLKTVKTTFGPILSSLGL